MVSYIKRGMQAEGKSVESHTFFFPSFSLPDMLSNPTDVTWREGTPFEAMTGHTSSSDGLLAEVFRDFLQSTRSIPGDLCTAPGVISFSLLSLADRRDLCDTQGKWSLKPNRSWKHSHTSLKPFWLQPMAPWKTRQVKCISKIHSRRVFGPKGYTNGEWRRLYNGNFTISTVDLI